MIRWIVGSSLKFRFIVVAMAVEAVMAGVAASTRRALSAHHLAVLNGASCALFAFIAVSLALRPVSA